MPTPPADTLQPFDASWRVLHPAVWIETSPDNDADADAAGVSDPWLLRPVTLLRHGGHPMRFALPAPGATDAAGWLPAEALLLSAARQYVDRIAEHPGLRGAPFDAAARALGAAANARGAAALPRDGQLDWLPIGWGADAVPAERRDPRRSFWVLRRDPSGQILDRSAVLLAARVVRAVDQQPLGVGGDVGLRVVMHVDLSADGGTAMLRITGASMSRLGSPGALDLLPPALLAALPDSAQEAARRGLAQLATDLGLHGDLVIQSLRTGQSQPPGTLRVQGEGCLARQAGRPDRRYAFVADVDSSSGRLHHRLSMSERVSGARPRPGSGSDVATKPRLAAAAGQLAQWISAEAAKAEALMQPAPLVTPAPPAQSAQASRAVQTAAAAPPRHNPDWYVLAPTPGPSPSLAQSPDPDLDRFCADLALNRGANLFDRLTAFGLAPPDYFKLAKLPLVLRNGAAMVGAPDGIGVNAEVRPQGSGLSSCRPWRSLAGGPPTDRRPRLVVRFGAAETDHRWQRRSSDGHLLQTQYLGLAIDPCWAWHEFGHVLAYASIGEMEFRFAHSAGDALAAIAVDADTTLAADAEARGRTFGLFSLPRRHDRAARLGWCWCGGRSRARLAPQDLAPDRRLGYFEEQLMSSSLFRLYRSLGGDTPPDKGDTARRSASEYCLYLIMRAIALLGPDNLVPARSADHFVSALIDADLGTGLWSVDVTGPDGPADSQPAVQTLFRQGGQVHKVIRWAFEAQGLYANTSAHQVVEGVGLPPPVDLYIADRRPAADGGYHPVPLRWQEPDKPAEQASPANAPLWLAAPTALRRLGNRIELTVHNRGQGDATGCSAMAWIWAPHAGDGGQWLALAPADKAPPDAVAGNGGRVRFSFAWPTAEWASSPEDWHWVLARTDCPADPANLPLDAPPPPPWDGSALLSWVAHDNNLALAKLTGG